MTDPGRGGAGTLGGGGVGCGGESGADWSGCIAEEAGRTFGRQGAPVLLRGGGVGADRGRGNDGSLTGLVVPSPGLGCNAAVYLEMVFFLVTVFVPERTF